MARWECEKKILPQFQIIRRFGFSRYNCFYHVSRQCVYLNAIMHAKVMYLEKYVLVQRKEDRALKISEG